MTPNFESNGWQAVVADRFTFANLRLVTQAICNHIRDLQSVIDNFPPRLVTGFDNRFMGQHFSEVATEVILDNGLDVFMADRSAPTPVVSFMISEYATTAALVITGGDEGAQYNGVKLITSRMAIASEDTTRQIEAELEQLTQMKHPLQVTASKGEKKLCNPKQGYFRHIQSMIDLEQVKGISDGVLVDYLHGIASGYLREILRQVGGNIQECQNSALYDFGGINPTLFTDNFTDFHREMAHQSELKMGLMIDGDGTNLQVFDGDGQLVSHGDIFALIVDYSIRDKEKIDGIVKPTQRHDLAEKVAQHHEVPIYFSQTSDFRVMTTHMVQDMANLAADGLGGYAFEGHIMERDALFTSLLLMEILAVRQCSLTEAIADVYQRYTPETVETDQNEN